MVNPLVSVIIVNYNSGPLLTECVERVLASTLLSKVYISDNASTDNTLDILKEKFENNEAVFVKKNTANLGFSAGNNAVYNLIDTPYVLYLNPDCLVNKDTIEQLVSILDTMPEAAIAGCLVNNMNGSEQAGCRGLTPTPKRVVHQLLKALKVIPGQNKLSGYLLSDTPLPQKPVYVELISGSCMLLRKKAIDEVGLLDDKYFLYCEDYDWFYRFIQHNWKIVFTPRTYVTHYKGASTNKVPLRVLVYKARGMWRYHDKFFRKNSSLMSSSLVRAGIILRLIILGSIALIRKVIN